MRISLSFTRFLTYLLPLAFLFSALCCKRTDPKPRPVEPPVTPEYPDSLAGTMQIQFNNNVDGQPLELETRQYKNTAGDTFTVTTLNYYISNVKLKNTQTGKTYIEKNSYHQINTKDGKKSFTLKGIPVKAFNELEFSIGIDSVQNAKTERIGDLNPDDDMSWVGTGQGYLFMRMSGYKISKNKTPKALIFHVGGNKNYRTVSMLFPSIVFEKGKPVAASMNANLNNMFKDPYLISFDQISTTGHSANGSSVAGMIADNYAKGMFTLQAVIK